MSSDEASLSSSSEEAVTIIKKRKHRTIVYSDSDSDSDIETRPKHRRKLKPVYESDTEIAPNHNESAESLVPEENASCDTNTSNNPCSHIQANLQVTCSKCLSSSNKKKPSNDSSENDEQSEKCPICLSKFLGQDVATPETCDHSFCLQCLQEWAKKVNTCPVDRLLFNLIFVRHHPGGKIIRTISVENKDFLEESDSSNDSTYCELCGSNSHEDRLLLCDDCDQGYHCDCLDPPLTSIPQGRWYCPECVTRRSNSRYLPNNLLSDFLVAVNNRFRPRRFPLTETEFESIRVSERYTHNVAQIGNQTVIRFHGHRQNRTSTRHRRIARLLSNSSFEQSDENVEQSQSSSRTLQESGDRRQNQMCKIPDASVRRGLMKCASPGNGRSRVFGFSTSYESEHENSDSLLPFESEEEAFGHRYGNGGDVAVASHARANLRNTAQLKGVHAIISPLRFRTRSLPLQGFSTIAASQNCDILGNILQTQAVLHSPLDCVIKRDGSLSVKQLPVGQQRPLNPVQQSSNTSNTSQRNVYYSGSSSSSSPVSGSSNIYDACNVPESTSVDNSGGGFGNNDPHALSSKGHCNASLSDEYRRDSHSTSQAKEAKNDRSEDDIDIYSDIESVGENETAVDDDIDEPVKPYKCEDSQLSNIDDGTDSSENELIIDEDVQVEEESDRTKDKCAETNSCISRNFKQLHSPETQEGSEDGICSDAADSYDEPHSGADDTNIKDKSDSFDGLDENSQDSASSVAKDLSHDELSCSNATPSDNQLRGQTELEIDYAHDENSSEKNEENSMDSTQGSSCDAEDKQMKVAKSITSPSELSHCTRDHEVDRELLESNSIVSGISGADDGEQVLDYEDPYSKVEDNEYTECAEREKRVSCVNESNSDEEMPLEQSGSEDKYSLTQMTDSNDQNIHFCVVKENLHNEKNNSSLQKENFKKSSNNSHFENNSFNRDSKLLHSGGGNPFSSEQFCDNSEIDITVKGKDKSDYSGHRDDPCAYSHSSNISNLNELGNVDMDCSFPHVGSSSSRNFNITLSDVNHSVEKQVDNLTETNFVLLDENKESSNKGSENDDDISDSHDTDLGIEDISEAGSDELNRNEIVNETTFNELKGSMDLSNTKQVRNLQQNDSCIFEEEDSSSKLKTNVDGSLKKISDKSGNYICEPKHFVQHTEDDQEEGEIIDEVPAQAKLNKPDLKSEYTHEEVEDYIDMTPRINIADLPRIPKIKRDKLKNNDVPEEPQSEVKRTSVLGRVDLGVTDISWKRLSKHTRERSYRDGRPKDERLLYREREGRMKEKKANEISDRRNEEKHRDQERRRDDSKKTELDRNKEKGQNDRSRDRKCEKVKDAHEKCNKNKDWNYGTPEKRDRDKQHEKTHKEKHEKDKHERDKDRHDRERHERDKDRYNRDEERYDRESEVCRFDKEDNRYEKIKHDKEKNRDKDRKHKHKDKDRKVEGCSKERSQSKHKRSHSREHFTEKQKEREVRKVDDKLKIVVEHKEPRKDKLDKHGDKKDSKHEKKHREDGHRHHEHRKRDHVSSPYMELAPIESKEIFAKGDSIIINVNFSRSSSRESVPSVEDNVSHFNRENKMSVCNDLSKADHIAISDDLRNNKPKHLVTEKERNVLETMGTKRPSTPPERVERNPQVLAVGESYWQESDDIEIKSPPEDKGSVDKVCSDDDNAVESGGAFDGDNFSDSEVEDLSENATLAIKSEEAESMSAISDKNTTEIFAKDGDDFSVSRRRSPHSPPPQSPPSPPDNDSYDPCEPTRSPSSVEGSPVPPPSSLSSSERPRPPPSPELPPLPPEPEPTDPLMREDPRSLKHNVPCPPSEFPVMSSASNDTTSQPSQYTQSSMPSISLPNIRVPPPNFIPHSVNRTTTTVPPQLVQSRTMNWSVSDPPSILYPANQVQHVVRGNFMQTSGLPPTPSTPIATQMGTVLQPTNSISIVSQVRHPQINSHAALTSNSLLPNVPLSHLNISQLQIPNVNHPPPNITASVSTPHSNMVVSIQNQPSSLPVSVQSQASSRTVSVHNQLTNISASIQNLPSTPPTSVSNQTVSLSSSVSSQSHLPPPPPIALLTSQKFEKSTKHSSPIDKTEVVDMDVDSPYSPGDSPSMDSTYDYSPPSSPLHRTAESGKDVFDNLLGTNSKNSLTDKHNVELSVKGFSHKASSKSRLTDHQSSRNSFEKPSKKQKLEDRSESSKARHSVRLQLTDKGKTSSVLRKEQKLSDKKEVLLKLDESQLKILDELPSSAVEMQVKEKHNLSLQFLKKLNRQERVVEEVKLSLKPYYTRREISKDEYKDVLRKSVPKICHNRSGDINPVKVKSLVEGYIKKIKYARKKAEKKNKASRFS